MDEVLLQCGGVCAPVRQIGVFLPVIVTAGPFKLISLQNKTSEGCRQSCLQEEQILRKE